MNRTISGCILPYGQPTKDARKLVFAPGSLRIPNDLGKVKLLRDHSTHGGGPVGVLSSWSVNADGLVLAEFTVPSTPDGDIALADAASVRNRFSIEATPITRNGPVITCAVLKSVALVPYPAFEKAEVTTVNAASQTDTGLIIAEDNGGDELITAAVDGTTAAVAHTTETPPAVSQNPVAGLPQTETPPAVAQAPTPTEVAPRPATVPAGLGGEVAERNDGMEFAEVVDRIMSARAGADGGDIIAELVDITNSDNIAATAPQWLGELWSGVTYQRRIIPLLTSASLKSWKAVGYRWTKKPRVAKYAGDKADIPSFETAIEPDEVTAERWAGGNDIDRKFLDFNDSEFLAAYWRMMAESYAFETDQDAAAFLAANATPLAGPYTDPVRAISAAGIAIDQAIHSPATFAIVNPADLSLLLDVSQLEAPYYGDITGVGNPNKWTTSEFVPSGTAIVGAKSAATHYELAGSPLRAQAQHIAKGGQDAALFGYTAMMVNRPEALLSVTFTGATPTPPPAEGA